MSMQLIKRSAQALGAAALFCSLPAFSATITPTGGSVSYMTPSTVPASYGSFSASQQETMWSGSTPVLTDVTLATLSGNFSANSLELSGYATTEFDAVDGFPHFGVIRGTLGFDLSDTSPMRFALSQATSGGAFNMYQAMTITLLNASNQVVLGCIGRGVFYFLDGGCKPNWYPGGDFSEIPDSGVFELTAGHYELSFWAQSNTFGFDNSPTDFDFRLSTVPLPASAWLLVSGLGLLVRRRR